MFLIVTFYLKGMILVDVILRVNDPLKPDIIAYALRILWVSHNLVYGNTNNSRLRIVLPSSR